MANAKAPVLGKTTKADLPANVFSEPFHESLVHEAAQADLAARRRGTASALTRAEVAMTTAKAWRQKGLGRARSGPLSVPHRRGGGAAFGPKPRRYTVALLDGAGFDEPSTKRAADALRKWGAEGPTLVVLDTDEIAALKSFRNIDRVTVLEAEGVGVADIVGARSLVVSNAALDTLAERARES